MAANRSDARRTAAAVALGIALWASACALPEIGIFDGERGSDIPTYQRAGELLLDGTLPYRDFYLEYPPGALPAFVVPALGPADDYASWFKALEAAFGAAVVALVAIALAGMGASAARLYAGTAFAALAPLALGPIVLTRYDLWPALLVVAALAALVYGRGRLGLGLLGASVAAKGFALVLLPPALLYLWRRRGRRGRREALVGLAVFCTVVVVIALPFLALGPGGLRYTVWVQIRRPLQIESLGSSLLLAAHHLGLYDVQVVSTYGSQNLAGGAAKALAALTTLAGAAAIVAVWLALARGPLDPRRVLAASAAVVAAFVAFDKVLSPQFLIWLVPLVPLVAGRTGAVAGALLLAALGLTQGWFPSRYRELVALGDVSWLVLARDLVLVALYGVLAAAVAASSASRSERT